jgi:hypothetical protein
MAARNGMRSASSHIRVERALPMRQRGTPFVNRFSTMRTQPLFDGVSGHRAGARPLLTKRELSSYVRRHTRSNLYDESGVNAEGVAVYGLSDPRDIHDVRYIGQTRAPASRFLQHLNTACLWLPDDLPWWVKSPKLRPLYSWIRTLYREDLRLPVMLINAWAPSTKEARLAERARIIERLSEGRELYNVEKEILGRQLPLI